ncbi:MAG: DUF4124 domain-containing protein [Betaproteobacteria bacterium]|jgi:hypothetical protein|nr:DUF4124 domain-containing protein [Betaproteobacteria bacterium]
MKPTRVAVSSSLFFLTFALAPFSASAQVFKCVDANGKVTYSNNGGSAKGCKQLSNEQSVSTISMRPNPSPAAFPKVSDDTQRERDKTRRQILEKELDSEQSALEEARKELTEQEATFQGGETFVNRQTGVRGVNYQKKLDRLQPYKDAVGRRERNIEALTQELSGLR